MRRHAFVPDIHRYVHGHHNVPPCPHLPLHTLAASTGKRTPRALEVSLGAPWGWLAPEFSWPAGPRPGVQAPIAPCWSRSDFGQEPWLQQLTSELLASGTGLSAAVGGRSLREPPPEAWLYDSCQGSQEVCMELVDTSAHVHSCPPGWYLNLSIFTW